jgi:hypothetical protein
MDKKIQTKLFCFGHEHESEWPPAFGSRQSGPMYYCKERKCMVEGYPPNPNNCFGVAPMVMFDEMPTTYHEAAGREVNSRKEWERLDRETGAITFGSREEPTKHIQNNVKQEEQALRDDRRRASLNAYQAYKENPQEVIQKVAKQTEQQMQTLEKSGIDINAIKHGVIAK